MVEHPRTSWKKLAIVLAFATGCGQLLGIDELTDGTTGSTSTSSSGMTSSAAGGTGGSGGTATGGAAGMGGSGACATLDANTKLVWAKQFGDKGDQFVSDAALLATGLLSVCGQMNAGNLTVGSDMLTNKESSLHGFVFQLTSTGEPAWGRVSNGKGVDWCSAVAANGSETLLTGTFTDTLAYDKNKPIGANDGIQAYVYGLAATAKATNTPLAFAGNQLQQIGKAVAPFSSGVLVAGTYHGTIGSSGDKITTTALDGAFAARVHAASSDYLVDLGDMDPAGTTSRSVSDGVVDSSDNAIIVGDFGGDVAFWGKAKAKNHGDRDVFIVKLDPSGIVLWARTFGSTGKDIPLAVALGPSESIYVAGMFGGTITLDGRDFPAVGGGDAFVFRFAAADGTLMDGFTLTGSGEQQFRKIAVAESGNLYAAGRNDGVMTTPSGKIEGVNDSFVVSYDNKGDWRGVLTFSDGPSASLLIGGIAIDGCRMVVTTHFGGTIQLGSETFDSIEGSDVLVAAYDLALD